MPESLWALVEPLVPAFARAALKARGWDGRPSIAYGAECRMRGVYLRVSLSDLE